MRAIWKGTIAFGLVNVPVKVFAATHSHDTGFHQVHAKDGGRIRYQRVCEIDGEEVPYADIAKGVTTEDGRSVVLTAEDLADLPVPSGREITVERFVPADQIDPLLLESSYYLEPDATGVRPYALLREVLGEEQRVAVVTVTLRSRTSPAVLRVRDDVIVLHLLRWPDEVRDPDFSSLAEAPAPAAKELKLARVLVEAMAGDFDASEFEDEYDVAVKALIEAKAEGVEPGEVKAEDAPAQVVDLMAALEKSVSDRKGKRSA